MKRIETSMRVVNGRLSQSGDGFRVKGKNGVRHLFAVFSCECGNKTITMLQNVRQGKTLSCGCMQKKRTSEASITHGHAPNGVRTPTLNSWESMITRCSDKAKGESKVNYFDRGIRVCYRWQSFETFLLDMGVKPKGMSIERKDNDGNYEPGNCRWATPQEQSVNKRNNRRLELNGRTMCLSEWAKELNVGRGVIRRRLAKGVFTEVIGSTEEAD